MTNRVVILGRLVNDPEIKMTDGGVYYSRATIANEQNYKDKKTTNFIDILAWGGLAQNLANYCSKGRKILIDGRLEIKKNKKGEVTYTNITILAENIDFLEQPKGEHEKENNFVEVDGNETPF